MHVGQRGETVEVPKKLFRRRGEFAVLNFVHIKRKKNCSEKEYMFKNLHT